jgi:hypothetical protein
MNMDKVFDKVFASLWTSLFVCVSVTLLFIATNYAISRLFLPKDSCDFVALSSGLPMLLGACYEAVDLHRKHHAGNRH